LDQTAPGFELNSLEAIICINRHLHNRCLILARKPVKGFVKERPENGRETKQVCAAL
jgi:hypothetical protein